MPTQESCDQVSRITVWIDMLTATMRHREAKRKKSTHVCVWSPFLSPITVESREVRLIKSLRFDF